MEDAKTKLDKEVFNLSLLKETVGKSSQLKSGMCGILSSFEGRLSKLEKTILPVYHETENLQRRQENIESTLKNLEYVIQFYAVAKNVEPIIRDGVRNTSLELYLKSMEELQGAQEFFARNKPNSEEMDEITSLFESGSKTLEREFHSLLSRSSKALPAIMILDLVNADDEIPQDNEKMIVQLLPGKVSKELHQIAQWLQLHKNEDFTNVYASVRADTLKASLIGLKEHQKSCSGNSSNMALHSSPMLGGRKNIGRETPSKKASKRIQQALMKKATAAILKYSSNVESAMLGHKFQSALMTEARDEIMDPEIEAFLTSVTALYKLMQSELQLMQGIIPSEYTGPIFERIIQPAADAVSTDGETLIGRVKKCVSKHDFQAALSLFPILRHLTSMKPDFEQLFESAGTNARSKLQGLLVMTQITMNKALEEFIENIKYDPDTKLPKDGTVHELTSNVIILLEQLQDFLDMAGTVLCISDTSQCKTKKNETDFNKLSLAQYITRVLAALHLALQNKSESYSDPYLKSIFRLNNYQYILKSLQRSGLSDIVHYYNQDFESLYNNEIREYKRIYSQSWSRVLHYVMEVDKPAQPRTSIPTSHSTTSFQGKLKDKEKQNIKDKFTGFNKEIEEIYKIQKSYAIPDVELRESMKRDNKEYILPKYQLFYDKYVCTNFTKNPDKYLKYTPLQVKELIEQFFDAAA